jgi:hypothetical protein
MISQDAMDLDTNTIELCPGGCRIFAVSKEGKKVSVGFFRKNAFESSELCRNFKFQIDRNKISEATFFFDSPFPKNVVEFAGKNSINCMTVDSLAEKISKVYEKFLQSQENQK